MRILSGIFKVRDQPTNATVGSGYRFLFGSSTSGKTVTERSAMQMTAVYSCVRILAEAVVGLPLHLYRYTDIGIKEKAIDHSLYALLWSTFFVTLMAKKNCKSATLHSVLQMGYDKHCNYGAHVVIVIVCKFLYCLVKRFLRFKFI